MQTAETVKLIAITVIMCLIVYLSLRLRFENDKTIPKTKKMINTPTLFFGSIIFIILKVYS